MVMSLMTKRSINRLKKLDSVQCEVFLSDITARKDQYHQDVEIINHNLNNLLANSHIKRVKHNNIKSQHLHDYRHLKRKRNQGEAMSGVQLFYKKHMKL